MLMIYVRMEGYVWISEINISAIVNQGLEVVPVNEVSNVKHFRDIHSVLLSYYDNELLL